MQPVLYMVRFNDKIDKEQKAEEKGEAKWKKKCWKY